MKNERVRHLKRFYRLLDTLEAKLDGSRMLAQCSKHSGWPQRGVYFFREPGEVRSDSGSGQRVVRVGANALKSGSGADLWKRLSHHRGTVRARGGYHRNSSFRKIVGRALINRDNLDYPIWGIGSSAPPNISRSEQPLEREVSRIIGDMPFLWLAIDDDSGPESQRAFIERNAIKLLSNICKEPLDAPSKGWLGHFCDRDGEEISGLWNRRIIDKPYNPEFLDALEQIIHGMK